MATPLPLDLRDLLAALIVEALGDGGAAPVARNGLATLFAYTRLAQPPDLAVSALDLVAGTTSDTPGGSFRDKVCGLEHLCLHVLVRANDRVMLHPAFRPYFTAVRERAAAYCQVLGAATAIRALPLDPLSRVLAGAAFLFNAGLFFEAHEVLEAGWRQARGQAKILLQGLVQIAVALHHYTNDNQEGARALLRKGSRKVCAAGTAAPALDANRLLKELRRWEEFLECYATHGKPAATKPALPRLRVPPFIL